VCVCECVHACVRVCVCGRMYVFVFCVCIRASMCVGVSVHGCVSENCAYV
jgi:hypothetical protein